MGKVLFYSPLLNSFFISERLRPKVPVSEKAIPKVRVLVFCVRRFFSNSEMNTLLCSTTILLCFLATTVNCQDDILGGGFWSKMREAFQNFASSIKDLWGEFRKEITARTADLRGFTKEAWTSFKEKMNEWINERPDMTESEKLDMTNYIERMKMPEEKNN